MWVNEETIKKRELSLMFENEGGGGRGGGGWMKSV